jgi:hypothetical protein
MRKKRETTQRIVPATEKMKRTKSPGGGASHDRDIPTIPVGCLKPKTKKVCVWVTWRDRRTAAITEWLLRNRFLLLWSRRYEVPKDQEDELKIRDVKA